MPRHVTATTLVVLLTLVVQACARDPKPGTVQDEAKRAGVPPERLILPTPDYFKGMDDNIVGPDGHHPALTQAEVEGRNQWLVWTAGNDRLWDQLTIDSLGTFDLLKTVSSHPPTPGYGTPYGRHNRWQYLGLINEPCFTEATGPDPKHFGLWLDQRDPTCAPDPFADETRYPGVKIGARGTTVPVGSYYGEPTGIVGLRLFPNPAFDEKARQRWNPERFYNDPTYYFDRDLVRPYRVGMSCGFCHVGPNPIKPPTNPEEPKWENLSSNVGAQFFWWDRVFNWRGEDNEASIFYQALHVSRPGTLDTSLVSTDNINNPRTMNAVYYLLPRMLQAKKWGKETLGGGGIDNKQFNNFFAPADLLSQFFASPTTTWTPRVLKDGADSVGALGALNRVYINIGVFSEEWLLHFRSVIGGRPITPIPIATAEKNSNYWRATELRTPDMARFFLATTDPHKLKDAPGGATYLSQDANALRQGKLVFAERCARCHSTKLPDLPASLDLSDTNGPAYLNAWNTYWAWTKTDEFKSKMRDLVLANDFLDGNFLSTELRVPAPLLGINMCSPLATNAIRDNIWDNFSSESYKLLPSAGSYTVRHPETGVESPPIVTPAGGRGYIRPASLVSLWSSAPFLQNNTVGPFDQDPSVQARMKRFDQAIAQMLWPELRAVDDVFKGQKGPGIGFIDRITKDSYLEVPEGYIPDFLRPLVGTARRLFPILGGGGNGYSIRIGPFPKGMSIGLITNIDLLGYDLSEAERAAHKKNVLRLIKKLKGELKGKQPLPDVLKAITDEMLAVSKCKDFVVNKGHYFGTSYFGEEPGLGDADKRALIEFLKTF